MRGGGVILVACACGAATALLASQAHAFQLPWRPLQPAAPARFGSARAATSSIERGRSGGSISTRQHATSLFGLEGLLQPVLPKQQPQPQPQQRQQQSPQQPQQQQSQGRDGEAARVREQFRLLLDILQVRPWVGWCVWLSVCRPRHTTTHNHSITQPLNHSITQPLIRPLMPSAWSASWAGCRW